MFMRNNGSAMFATLFVDHDYTIVHDYVIARSTKFEGVHHIIVILELEWSGLSHSASQNRKMQGISFE